jgi:heterotetrameric sarcosine oxidase gamma subunit
MTDFNPVFRSPIIVREPVDRTPSAGDQGLTLSDQTGVPVILIQGEANDILQERLPHIPAQPGDLTDAGDGLLARLTPTELYLFGKFPAASLPSVRELDDSLARAERFAHATDYTHGKAALRLVGPPACELLSKICGLDFRDRAFPNLHAGQTSAAKISTFVARFDEGNTPAYFLHVSRPLGQYFWEIVWGVGQEFGIVRV